MDDQDCDSEKPLNRQSDVVEKHYDEGKIKSRMHIIKNGTAHGKFQAWFKNGQLQFEIDYVRGKAHGQYRQWSKDGCEIASGLVVQGLRHGVWCFTRHDQNKYQISFALDMPFKRGFYRLPKLRDPANEVDNVQEIRIMGQLAILALLAGAAAIFPSLLGLGIVLFLVILIHEFGHFTAALFLGIPVTVFRIGAGPPLTSWYFNSTRFEISPLLFVGFVQCFVCYRKDFEQFNHAYRQFLSDQPFDIPSPSTSLAGRIPVVQFFARRDRLIFSLGGCAANLTIAAIAIFLAVLIPGAEQDGQLEPAVDAAEQIGAVILYGTWREKLIYFGTINASLAVINLLPLSIPFFIALDGKHCLDAIFEKHWLFTWMNGLSFLLTILLLVGAIIYIFNGGSAWKLEMILLDFADDWLN